MNPGTKLILEKRLESIVSFLRAEQKLLNGTGWVAGQSGLDEDESRRLGVAAGLCESALRSVQKVVPR